MNLHRTTELVTMAIQHHTSAQDAFASKVAGPDDSVLANLIETTGLLNNAVAELLKQLPVETPKPIEDPSPASCIDDFTGKALSKQANELLRNLKANMGDETPEKLQEKDLHVAIYRIECVVKELMALDTYMTWPGITNDARKHNMTDCDCYVAWRIGFKAFQAVKAVGGKFPHE